MWWQARPTWVAQALRPIAALYGAIVHWRRATIKPHALPVPVIVVGNLVVGGAGKTPATIALVQALQARGWNPGVVSRGHGRTKASRQRQPILTLQADTLPSASGDEPLLIHRRTAAPTVVGADRVAAAQQLLQQHPMVNVIVADDGLQHHRLGRNAQCIVVDERGLGNGLLLPAGPLREPFAASPPARSVVLYNALAPATAWPGWLAQRGVTRAVRLDAWWRGEAGSPEALQALQGRPLVAAAGVASPERFFSMLEAQGLRFVRCPLPDHFDWQSNAAGNGHVGLRLAQGEHLVITEKDAIKLPLDHAWHARTWVVPLDFGLPQALVNTLLTWVPPDTPASPPP